MPLIFRKQGRVPIPNTIENMTWDNILDVLKAAGLDPVEEIYMENYGKILAAQRPEFSGRYFRCAYGVLKCSGLRVEVLLFPDEGHLQEFHEIAGDDPWRVARGNAIFYFPISDPAVVGNILEAISGSPR
jgi:hypothetical protein